MAEEAEKIGGRMAERRGELDLTQREVAERMPGSYQGPDISRWERGKHRPEPLAEIAVALETEVADLIQGPLKDRKVETKSKGKKDLLDQLTAQAGDGKLAKEVADLREEVGGVAAEVEGMTGLLQTLATDLKSVQDDLAILKRRKAG